jgi:hypothetical protein
LILNTFTNYKIYISVLTGHELEQIPWKTAYYKYSYGKWILVGYVTEEIKPLKTKNNGK